MCSLLQPIVLRDVLHVVRHGALHIFRALLSIACADMVSCLPSICFLHLQQLADCVFVRKLANMSLNSALLHTKQIGTRKFRVSYCQARQSVDVFLAVKIVHSPAK